MEEKLNQDIKDILNSTILIVDDIPIENNPIKDFLLSRNYNVLHAGNGKNALEIVKKEKIDLIILDIMMLEMDGYEICKKLKQDKETSIIPIIFLTAKGDIESILKGFEYGAEDYIIKPFNGVEVLARINTHLELKFQREILSSVNKMLADKIKEKTKELEIANKKLSTLEKAKNNFLSLISHEVRTPLNAIMGFTALFELTELTNEQKEYLHYLKDSTNKLLKLSESALLISSLTLDEYDVRFNYIFLKDIVKNAIDNLKNKIENKNIVVLTNFLKDLSIKADFNLTVKVIELSLENFIDYAKKNQKITIEVNDNNKDYTLVKIITKKKFINYNETEKILKIFLLTYNKKENDLGLGLTTIKYIMDAHSGKIELENNSDYFAINLYFNKNI